MDSQIIFLLRIIGSPFAPDYFHEKASYSRQLYLLADGNKIPLTYLNSLSPDERRTVPEYNYHNARLERMLDIMAEISELFNRESIDYVVFKTLRHYPKYVSDIDVLNLGSHRDYDSMMEALRGRGYIFMEKGAYCTTSQDHKTRFKTEAMIDIYDQVSVGHLIYLDKRKLSSYVVEKDLPEGSKTKVFTPEVELLVAVAHSAIKENRYILAEYYATLNYLAEMNRASISRFVGLVKDNKLVNVARWHFTITAMLHREAHGIVPKKLVDLLSNIGDPWNMSCERLNGAVPPYQVDPLTLACIFREKLQDKVFRRSLFSQLSKPLNRVSMMRLLEKLGEVL